MKLPDGYGDMLGKIVRLSRSLYCPKQSRRRWAGILVETVVVIGMVQSKTNPCVFSIDVDDKLQLNMGLHLDEIFIAGSDEACRHVHAALNTKFFTNNPGE